MKTLLDNTLQIEEALKKLNKGFKPAKALKYAGFDFDTESDLADSAKALKLINENKIKIATTEEEINAVYMRGEIKSCMTDYPVGEFWASVDIVCVHTEKSRALVNPMTKTFYKCYGGEHYVLKCALKLLGFECNSGWLRGVSAKGEWVDITIYDRVKVADEPYEFMYRHKGVTLKRVYEVAPVYKSQNPTRLYLNSYRDLVDIKTFDENCIYLVENYELLQEFKRRFKRAKFYVSIYRDEYVYNGTTQIKKASVKRAVMKNRPRVIKVWKQHLEHTFKPYIDGIYKTIDEKPKKRAREKSIEEYSEEMLYLSKKDLSKLKLK